MRTSTVSALATAAHLGPALAVTALATAYAGSLGLGAPQVLLVAGAVLAGQLTIGWSNDLLDRDRDREVGRRDKPLATGTLPARTVLVALASALVATLVLSALCGLAAGAVHLLLVASGWAYNLGLKATVWSWVPYAVTFGGLPVFVHLLDGDLPPLWAPVATALLGVGAHLLNALPDLVDDERTGVRGMPHRLGPDRAPAVAVALLTGATLVLATAAAPTSLIAVAAALALVAGLAVVALRGHGRRPFQAAVGIAAVDVVMLVVVR
jgi:4-hydroxybenzoate polyprenyltransferase